MYPDDLRYTNDHEWAREGGDGTLTVGITDWAQKQLGDVVFVELPKVGDTFEAGEPFGSVESVKAVSELYAPVGGSVQATNGQVVNEEPELLNTDPYGEGWLIKLRPTDANAYGELLTAAEYEDHVRQEDG